METTSCKIRSVLSGLLVIAIFTACAPVGTPTPADSPGSPATETPQPRETADPITAFAGPILLAIQDRPPDFQDDFSEASASWIFEMAPVPDRGNIEIANGVLMMSTDPDQIADARHFQMAFDNFVMRVDVNLLDLDAQKQVNLLWRRDDAGAEVFQLRNEGSWSLLCYFAECPVFASGSESVDLSGPVAITVVSKGTEFAVYLNNTPLAYHNDIGRPQASGITLELWVNTENEGTAAIAYDNLSVWNLDPVFPPPTATPEPWVTGFASPILLAIQGRHPDFEDDFSQDTNGWLTRANAPQDLGNVAVTNGGLIMNPGPGISGTADHHSTSIRDFVVQVDVDFLELNVPGAARLEWLRYELYNGTATTQSFDIHADGSWYLWSCPVAAPGNSPECQETLPSDYTSVDLSEPVTVMLISKGTELAVYLNGTPLIYYNYLGQPPASHVRLFSWDDSDNPGHLGIAFDNFKIWELQSVFPPPAPDPALGIGSSMERPADGMVMMYVPEGEFLMGSDTGDPNSQPVHAVYLDAFWIDRTEVTYDMFARFLTEMGNQSIVTWEFMPPDTIWFNPEGSGNVAHIFPVPGGSAWQAQSGYGELAATGMNWYGAQAYCAWAGGGRLPTEAEWEKAARGGLQGRLYPWGDEPPTCTLEASNGAWIGVPCGRMNIPPVGSYAPNGYGLYDMLGSVNEWTAGWYSPTYYAFSPYRNPLGAREDWTGEQGMPLHPSIANYPETDLDELGIASRDGWPAWNNRGSWGFRCVRSP